MKLADQTAASRWRRWRGATDAAMRLGVVVLLVITGLATSQAAGDHRRYTLEVDRRIRSYLVHRSQAPPDDGDPVALLIVLHGGGGNAESAMAQTGFNDLADRWGFLAVYPDGTGPARPLLNALGRGRFFTWNAGSCCGYAARHQVDDAAFIRALVREMQRRYPIDPQRIYAAGMSNGAMMAYRLACEMSDVLAAIGAVAGTMTVQPCQPVRPVPLIHIHGTADRNVPLRGGVGDKSWDGTPKAPVPDTIEFWANRNGCAATPRITRQNGLTRYNYPGSYEVVLYLVKGGGHAWPGGRRLLRFLDEPTQTISASDLIWQFLAAHPKSPP